MRTIAHDLKIANARKWDASVNLTVADLPTKDVACAIIRFEQSSTMKRP